MKNVFFFGSIFLLLMASCKPAKKIQTIVSTNDTSKIIPITSPKIDSAAIKADIVRRVNSNHIDFTYFSGKIKLDYIDQNGKSVNATAFVRISRDSIIWLSVTGLLGIEGFRVVVSPDTVIIMDKIEKTISYKSVAYLQEMIKLPVDFYTLQDLLVGNPIFIPDNIISFRHSGNNLVVLGTGEYFKNLITIDTTDNRILQFKLDDVKEERNRTCLVSMGDYNQQQGRLFSNFREIIVTEKGKLEIKLEYKQVVFDEPQTFPFNIPKNYKLK